MTSINNVDDNNDDVLYDFNKVTIVLLNFWNAFFQ